MTVMRKRVLVVDDDRQARLKARRALAGGDFDVDLAESGDQALQALAEKAYDVMLLDIVMPGTDGIEVLERLHGEATPATIVVSSSDDPEGRERCHALGVRVFLQKPVDPDVLLSQVQALVGTMNEASEQGAAVSGEPRCHVLAVDDNRINRLKITRALGADFQITQAEDGEQALALLRTQAFDLVLLDLVMPGVDGFEVLRQMQQAPRLRDVPVIVISGVEESEGFERALKLGATACVAKPFDPAELNARVNACLQTG